MLICPKITTILIGRVQREAKYVNMETVQYKRGLAKSTQTKICLKLLNVYGYYNKAASIKSHYSTYVI